MTVISLNESGEPIAPAVVVQAQGGHHPYPGMPGVSGMVKPGMLLDITI